jgi:hypothetical protein
MAASAFAQTTNFTDLVVYGAPQDVQAAIDKGADVNAHSDYRSALMVAAAYNENPAVIAILLKAGADMEAEDGAYGMTALMWATRHNGNPEVILTLLKAGADVKAKSDEGKTAFDYAQKVTRKVCHSWSARQGIHEHFEWRMQVFRPRSWDILGFRAGFRSLRKCQIITERISLACAAGELYNSSLHGSDGVPARSLT